MVRSSGQCPHAAICHCQYRLEQTLRTLIRLQTSKFMQPVFGTGNLRQKAPNRGACFRNPDLMVNMRFPGLVNVCASPNATVSGAALLSTNRPACSTTREVRLYCRLHIAWTIRYNLLRRMPILLPATRCSVSKNALGFTAQIATPGTHTFQQVSLNLGNAVGIRTIMHLLRLLTINASGNSVLNSRSLWVCARLYDLFVLAALPISCSLRGIFRLFIYADLSHTQKCSTSLQGLSEK